MIRFSFDFNSSSNLTPVAAKTKLDGSLAYDLREKKKKCTQSLFLFAYL